MKKWRGFCTVPLSAMIIKELRQGMRRGIFVLPFLSIHALAIRAIWNEYQTGFAPVYTDYTGALNIFLFLPGTPAFSGSFWLLVGLLCVLVMPLGGLGMMRGETEEKNHELILLTRLTRWEVVLGKFLALWGLIMLTFVSLLPYVLLRYFIGGWDTKRNLALIGTVVLGSGLACALSIGASSGRSHGRRILIFGILGSSLLFGGFVTMMFAAGVSNQCGFWYHLNAVSACLTYTLLGLGWARTSLHIAQGSRPNTNSGAFLAVALAMPPVSWVATALTAGHFGALALLIFAFIIWRSDVEVRDSSLI